MYNIMITIIMIICLEFFSDSSGTSNYTINEQLPAMRVFRRSE